ncbi:MAG: ATP-binding cassette domain-containing protein [Candidatus Dojkabacteria bacterium]
MKQEIIKVENLVKKFKIQKKNGVGIGSSLRSFFNTEYDEIVAVDGIDLSIYREEFVAFIGPNGAGKTTTLKCLSGLLYPDGGSVTVAGFTPSKRKYEYLEKISLVMGQRSQLWWELPASETFLLNKEIYQVEEKRYREILGEMVELLGLESIINVPVRKLSLGERMKCELVASLIHTPEILFLDEPTIGLDVVSQQKLRDFLKEYNCRYKATIILTSHNMEDIRDLCKRGIVIDRGKIIYDGKISDLNKRFVKKKYLHFVLRETVSSKELFELGEVVDFAGNAGVLSVGREDIASVTTRLLGKYNVEDLDIQEPSLENIVKSIFEGKYEV